MKRRAFKIQEFPAHSSNVNCLRIGRKSSQVLVTGGDDKKVNIWAIGKPNAIFSLAGHTSPVESVCFDSGDEYVVAGASSGTIKLWDLEQAKVLRTLTGHRSNCVAVDFHPYGDFFASGSMDTNLKVWDIRRKTCIQTYKGHTKSISQVRFSPDGRWVVSGGEDGSVKLWDLTAGKLMHDFASHEGDVTAVDYHPSEFLLATASADRTVKFWDLETFELVASTPPEATPVRAITFTPDGRSLLSATQDSLKVWDWEPVKCHDLVEVSWNKVCDLSVNSSFQLVGCNHNQSFCAVWVINLKDVAPYSSEPAVDRGGVADASSAASAPPQREPPKPSAADEAARAPLGRDGRPEPSVRTASAATSTAGATPSRSIEARQWPAAAPHRTDEVSRVELSSTGNHVSMGIGTDLPAELPPQGRRTSSDAVSTFNARLDAIKSSRAGGGVSSAAGLPEARPPQPSTSDRPVHTTQNRNAQPSTSDRPVPIPQTRNVTAFIEKDGGSAASAAGSEASVLDSLLGNHDRMCSDLSARLENIRRLRALWRSGDIKGTLEALSTIDDHGAAVDILSIVWSKSNIFSLDICVSLLPLLKELLGSPHDEYVITAMQVLQIILQSFGPLISQTRLASANQSFVDIQMEERIRKCDFCYTQLLAVHKELSQMRRNSGKIGELLTVLKFTLQGFCS